MAATANLDQILEEIWTGLEAGANNSRDEFYTATFGTVHEQNSRLRTVVLRQVDPASRRLACYTDVRSLKVTELRENPAASWLFWSASRKIQIRAEGQAVIYWQDATARTAWEEVPTGSRRAYATIHAPGTPLDAPGDDLPEAWQGRSPGQEESETGWPNFAIIATTVERFDWVSLDPQGYRRARFEWNGSRFKGSWLVP